MRTWHPPDLQLGEGADKIMLPYCDKWIHIAMAAIYRLAGLDAVAAGVYPQAVVWAERQVRLLKQAETPAPAPTMVYVLLLWDFNESQVVGVGATLAAAKRLAEASTREIMERFGGWTGTLNWRTPRHGEGKFLTVADCPEHDIYSIDAYVLEQE